MQIKKEFRGLIPPLTNEEFEQLEKNCLDYGIRDKLIIWNDFIVDGHNRYDIAQKHNLDFKTEEVDFADEEEAKIFIIDLQLARRNLSEFVKIELQSKKKEILLIIGKEKKIEAGKLYGEKHPKEDLLLNNKTSHNTQKILADELKISPAKLAQAEVIIKKAPEEVKEKK